MNSLESLDALTTLLLGDGSAWVSRDDSLLQEQSALGLFNDVGAQLQEVLGDEDLALNMATKEGGLLLTLKVGDEANEPPDFSPPEPRLL